MCTIIVIESSPDTTLAYFTSAFPLNRSVLQLSMLKTKWVLSAFSFLTLFKSPASNPLFSITRWNATNFSICTSCAGLVKTFQSGHAQQCYWPSWTVEHLSLPFSTTLTPEILRFARYGLLSSADSIIDTASVNKLGAENSPRSLSNYGNRISYSS